MTTIHSETREPKTWSYSRLSSYHQCPYSFFLQYKEKRDGESNSWSDVGLLCHEILESVARLEMPPEASLDYFEEYYPVTSFPDDGFMAGYSVKIYESLHKYFSEFSGIDGEPLGVEEEFSIDLPNGDKLIGFIDLVKRKDDIVVVTDYKISNPFKKKDIESKEKQLYVYAIAVHAKYGFYPDKMEWHHLKDDKIVSIDFDESKVSKTIDWVMNTIEAIETDEQFEAKTDFFFCKNLCNFRSTCEFNI